MRYQSPWYILIHRQPDFQIRRASGLSISPTASRPRHSPVVSGPGRQLIVDAVMESEQLHQNKRRAGIWSCNMLEASCRGYIIYRNAGVSDAPTISETSSNILYRYTTENRCLNDVHCMQFRTIKARMLYSTNFLLVVRSIGVLFFRLKFRKPIDKVS